MKVIRNITEFDRVKPGCVLTIGNFDGVHAGHQEILRVAGEMARARDTEVVVMTFEPHPVAVLFPEKAPKVLTPLTQKLSLLRALGPGAIIILEDSRELLGLSARAFVEQFLMTHIRPSAIVEGHDFHFGAKRSGNVDTLQELGAEFGFAVHVVPPLHITFSTDQSLRASSTVIRYMLEAGHVADAQIALGRPFRLWERVVAGRGKGREIGFPTLNLKIPDQILPAEGVYAGTVELADSPEDLFTVSEQCPAVFSIGQARTFGDTIPLLVEAHLLDHAVSQMPSHWMAMDFLCHLRSQHKYKSVDDLVRQITLDCERARAFIASQDSRQTGV